MNLLLSDLALAKNLPERPENRYVDLSVLSIANCIGCFGCWTKTPGRCVIRDDATAIYPLIAQSSRVIYVSRIRYGSYDIPMKTMLERAIPIQQAFIRLYHGETHHVQRQVAQKDAVIIIYGKTSKEERDIFRHLVARNANNMLFKSWHILFVPQEQLEETIRKEVDKWER